LSKPVYILGAGLSHDGSACLLKDGKVIVAIEKERLTRRKHDGGNDRAAVQYCLEAAGITLSDLSLVVQCANFEKAEIRKSQYSGQRLFAEDTDIPFATLSHHLAHAWSAIGNCPFPGANVLVVDGCGSFFHQCDDLTGLELPAHVNATPDLYGEKDSFYHFDGQRLHPLYKDFSPIALYGNDYPVRLPTSRHSIGGLYAMASEYCFGDLSDAGKLMGLAPYGEPGKYKQPLFDCKDGHVWVHEPVLHEFTLPADPVHRPLRAHFQYYANIARWVQDELERAILYVVRQRLALHPHPHLCYAGGLALNAVANKRILLETGIERLYIPPPAGDNGLSIGCAYYGWMQVMQQEKPAHQPSVFLGKTYDRDSVIAAWHSLTAQEGVQMQEYDNDDIIDVTAHHLAQGCIIGWYQEGAELGPRALGHRSILADPRLPGIRDRINASVKFREDFRPFAPAVLAEDVALYFENALESPYMLLVDNIRPEWRDVLQGVVHTDGSGRLQTVTPDWNPSFQQLIAAFKAQTGSGVLINTSLNRKGMPIVETPAEALQLFTTTAIDVLVVNRFIFTKNSNA
jgi:carbamoyltransferase